MCHSRSKMFAKSASDPNGRPFDNSFFFGRNDVQTIDGMPGVERRHEIRADEAVDAGNENCHFIFIKLTVSRIFFSEDAPNTTDCKFRELINS